MHDLLIGNNIGSRGLEEPDQEENSEEVASVTTRAQEKLSSD